MPHATNKHIIKLNVLYNIRAKIFAASSLCVLSDTACRESNMSLFWMVYIYPTLRQYIKELGKRHNSKHMAMSKQ